MDRCNVQVEVRVRSQLNIHANMKDTWKHVHGESYIIWNGRIYFRTYKGAFMSLKESETDTLWLTWMSVSVLGP